MATRFTVVLAILVLPCLVHSRSERQYKMSWKGSCFIIFVDNEENYVGKETETGLREKYKDILPGFHKQEDLQDGFCRYLKGLSRSEVDAFNAAKLSRQEDFLAKWKRQAGARKAEETSKAAGQRMDTKLADERTDVGGLSAHGRQVSGPGSDQALIGHQKFENTRGVGKDMPRPPGQAAQLPGAGSGSAVLRDRGTSFKADRGGLFTAHPRTPGDLCYALNRCEPQATIDDFGEYRLDRLNAKQDSAKQALKRPPYTAEAVAREWSAPSPGKVVNDISEMSREKTETVMGGITRVVEKVSFGAVPALVDKVSLGKFTYEDVPHAVGKMAQGKLKERVDPYRPLIGEELPARRSGNGVSAPGERPAPLSEGTKWSRKIKVDPSGLLHAARGELPPVDVEAGVSVRRDKRSESGAFRTVVKGELDSGYRAAQGQRSIATVGFSGSAEVTNKDIEEDGAEFSAGLKGSWQSGIDRPPETKVGASLSLKFAGGHFSKGMGKVIGVFKG